MPKQSHPAQRARFAAGLAGATGFVAMVPAIADGSTQPTSVGLAAVVDEARASYALRLELQGSGLAGAAASTGADLGQTEPNAGSAVAGSPAASPEVAETTVAAADPGESTPATEPAQATDSVAPTTTAAPAPTTTAAPAPTAAPIPDTISSAS